MASPSDPVAPPSDSTTPTTAPAPASAAAPLPARTQSLPSAPHFAPGHSTLQRTATTANVLLPPPDDTDFSYRHYTPTPEVAYTTSMDVADELLGRLEGPVLGFDMEWPWSSKSTWNVRMRRTDYVETTGKVALIQVCDEDLIVLIHLMDGNNTKLPQKLIDILQDPNMYKTGVQVRGDGIKLYLDFPGAFPSGIKSLLELNNIARCIDADNAVYHDKPPERLAGLAALTFAYLEKRLDKSPSKRQSNWALGLNERQIEYAASDAYVGLQLYFHLKRLAAEQGLRLILDNCSNNITPDGKHYRTPVPSLSRLRRCTTDTKGDNDGGFLPAGVYCAEHASNEDEDGSATETEGDEDDQERVSRGKRRKLGPTAETAEVTGGSNGVQPKKLLAQDSGVEMSNAGRAAGNAGGTEAGVGEKTNVLLGGWSLAELAAAAVSDDLDEARNV